MLYITLSISIFIYNNLRPAEINKHSNPYIQIDFNENNDI